MDKSGSQRQVSLSELSGDDLELVNAARRALEHAYAPYSGVHVGAALGTPEGVFSGCNVENASFSLTLCAERTAAVKAVSAGSAVFTALAIASSLDAPLMPCGACRQFLAEFGLGLRVLIVGRETDFAFSTTLADLLPGAFLPEDLRP